MAKPRKKRAKTIGIAPPYNLLLMEQIKTQLTLAREMTQLATEIRACLAQIERTLREGKPAKIVPFRERPF